MTTGYIGAAIENMDHWDDRFIGLAAHVSQWSKDPSTKVGAVIVDEANRIISVGFNGFPARVRDTPERYGDRDTKLHLIVHADANALLFAGRSVKGCRMYTYPFPPCSTCAGLIIQSGIREVVSVWPMISILERWGADLEKAAEMYQEAGVSIYLMNGIVTERERK